MRKRWNAVMRQVGRGLLWAGILLVSGAPAQADLVAGRDYTKLAVALPPRNPDKVEVIEFFSYACPQCNRVQGPLAQWSAGLPRDVDYRRVPTAFHRASWSGLVRLYYALEMTGQLTRVDPLVFDAIHKKHTALFEPTRIFDWAATQGVDRAKISDAYNSFAAQAREKQAEQWADAAHLPTIPAVLVDGRYLVSGASDMTPAQFVERIDQVITLARSDRGRR